MGRAATLLRSRGVARPAADAVRAMCTAEPYTVRQKKMGRFVSPHLTVHKTTWEIHALSSVTNRVTGVFATIGASERTRAGIMGARGEEGRAIRGGAI